MPGCLILDIRMPQQDGFELHETLLHERRRLPVIFMTGHADAATAVKAMKSGAVEFLEKPFGREILLNSVRKALALDAEWRRSDLEYFALADRMWKLSERDRETLALIRAGESNKAMAGKLFITERAVEMRRSAIMKKMQVSSVAELIELTTVYRILTELRQSENSP
jgi:FixJ family two-component response regulator